MDDGYTWKICPFLEEKKGGEMYGGGERAEVWERTEKRVVMEAKLNNMVKLIN